MAPGVDSASTRNEYQEYFLGGKGGRCVGLTTLLPSCAECHEIWEPQPPGTLRACLEIALPLSFSSRFLFYIVHEVSHSKHFLYSIGISPQYSLRTASFLQTSYQIFMQFLSI